MVLVYTNDRLHHFRCGRRGVWIEIQHGAALVAQCHGDRRSLVPFAEREHATHPPILLKRFRTEQAHDHIRPKSTHVQASAGEPLSQVQFLHPAASGMQQVSQGQTVYGVGRLHRGHRNMGCVGYSLQNISGTKTVVRFDPMPDAAHGDVFHLTLEDGRILECQVLNEYTTYCAVLDGPRVERRHHRRPAPTTRAYL